MVRIKSAKNIQLCLLPSSVAVISNTKPRNSSFGEDLGLLLNTWILMSFELHSGWISKDSAPYLLDSANTLNCEVPDSYERHTWRLVIPCSLPLWRPNDRIGVDLGSHLCCVLTTLVVAMKQTALPFLHCLHTVPSSLRLNSCYGKSWRYFRWSRRRRQVLELHEKRAFFPYKSTESASFLYWINVFPALTPYAVS